MENYADEPKNHFTEEQTSNHKPLRLFVLITAVLIVLLSVTLFLIEINSNFN